MKKRSMILALASMLGISAAATAVSGFAWFTTQTTASVKAAAYKVGVSAGSLQIALPTTSGLYNCTASTSGTSSATITPNSEAVLADVSSLNGKDFYKLSNIVSVEADLEHSITAKHTADFNTETAKPDTAGAWMSVVNNKQMVAISWKLEVSNGATDESTIDVYLSNAGTIFSKASTLAAEDPDYKEFYRLAVHDETGACVYLFTNSGHLKGLTTSDKNDDGTFKYVDEEGKKWDGASTALVAGTTCVTEATQKAIVNSKSEGIVADGSVTAGNLLLINDLGQTTKTLTFTVWCEGTATPEAAVSAANSVDMAFELVGIK